MEGIEQNLFLRTEVDPKFRYYATSSSIILFFAFVIFLSFTVNKFINNTISLNLVSPTALTLPEDEYFDDSSATITVKKRDSFKSILNSQKLPKSDLDQIIKIANEHKISAKLKAGQKVIFDYDIKIIEDDEHDLATEIRKLGSITIKFDKINSIEILREGDSFIANLKKVQLNKFVTKASTVIGSNFIAALKALKISTNSIIELTNAYNYQIDFQRQIKPGDTITVITEKFVNENGDFFHHGKILFASLKLSGKEYNIYRFSPDKESNNIFFTEDGKSVKRSLLRTPLKLLRVSSKFGHRTHPIHGYSVMHRGVDFAAAIGTPIFAAGDGVITEIGWKSGYGKWVQIKHSATLSTAYAHASKFANNLKAGSRVKQGQVIAYVGKTGKTTGAHLHYEVKINGKHQNPMLTKTTPGAALTGKTLAKFHEHKNKFKDLSKKLDSNSQLAAN